jgi:hypothetical protein
MREGILAAFEEANRAGGITGRKLELKSIDDGYAVRKTSVTMPQSATPASKIDHSDGFIAHSLPSLTT